MELNTPRGRLCSAPAMGFSRRRMAVAILFLTMGIDMPVWAQADATTPLHALQPDYPVPYGPMSEEKITEVLYRVRAYLDDQTPARLVDRNGAEVTDLSQADGAIIEPKGFRIVSYEWGVVYAGMLLAAEVTDDARFADYVAERLKFIASLASYYRGRDIRPNNPVRSVLDPRALDDAGSMCAAIIKAQRAGIEGEFRPMIDNYIDWISNKQFRFWDGTLARNRPKPDTLWLDDLFMSVPALAQMGKLTGEQRYFDDAVRQVLQFADRMFVPEKGLYMHGWVMGMEEHPIYHWARANGWAIMAKVELLDVLPEDHPGYDKVLALVRAHLKGLIAQQSGVGLWHQLLDRHDSYLETSATAIYTFCLARAINRGWVDPQVYGPPAQLAWNAVTTKINERGQVEGTCVGTGMAFDPAFYYHRPINVYAAHGYGPVLLAGAEMIQMVRHHDAEINDSAMMVEAKD